LTRPTLEVADIFRRFGGEYRRRRKLPVQQHRVMRAIESCRTAALGGHVDRCNHCDHERISYNSCRNRHCPKCQNGKRAQWVERRRAELLPIEYFHVVFTIPEQLNGVALQNKAAIYKLLFEASARTLQTIAADPKHLGARIGFFSILHTWGQNLLFHPHIHVVATGGGLGLDGATWISCRPGFFLPVRVLSRLFRRLFIQVLRALFDAGQLQFHRSLQPQREHFHQLLDQLAQIEWVVYAKPPFGGPAQVLEYLGRYTHRIAISNDRLRSMGDSTVTFDWKDYRQKDQCKARRMTLDADEFMRRFLEHVLPPRFARIRHYGLLSGCNKKRLLPLCRKLLTPPECCLPEPDEIAAFSSTLAAPDLTLCPRCGLGHMLRIQQLIRIPLPRTQVLDSS
jgi:hypothetical protein